MLIGCVAAVMSLLVLIGPADVLRVSPTIPQAQA
jgi:hypothetical protein